MKIDHRKLKIMLQLRIVSPEKVEYATKEGKTSLDILGGFVEVQKNVVSLCVELAE